MHRLIHEVAGSVRQVDADVSVERLRARSGARAEALAAAIGFKVKGAVLSDVAKPTWTKVPRPRPIRARVLS